MHCVSCGDQTVEVRPCTIGVLDNPTLEGDSYICLSCAVKLSATYKYSNFFTWLGMPCDRCSTPTSFDGPVPGMREGIVCEQCKGHEPTSDLVSGNRGVWVCEPCFELDHHGHKQKELQPLLDRLAREFGVKTRPSDA